MLITVDDRLGPAVSDPDLLQAGVQFTDDVLLSFIPAATWSFGLGMTMLSNMETGAGSVEVSAGRPCPGTCSTSGTPLDDGRPGPG